MGRKRCKDHKECHDAAIFGEDYCVMHCLRHLREEVERLEAEIDKSKSEVVRLRGNVESQLHVTRLANEDTRRVAAQRNELEKALDLIAKGVEAHYFIGGEPKKALIRIQSILREYEHKSKK